MAPQGRNRSVSRSKGIRFGGEELGPEEIARIRGIVRRRHGAPRGELSRRVCRAFDWRRTNGELRVRACLDLLVRLDAQGLVRLPPPRSAGSRKAQKKAPVGEAFLVPPPSLKAEDVPLGEVRVRPIQQGELPRWREAMARFHYLGDGRIVGEVLRYVAESEGRWVALLGWGCLSRDAPRGRRSRELQPLGRRSRRVRSASPRPSTDRDLLLELSDRGLVAKPQA